jgi:hypothetical protein
MRSGRVGWPSNSKLAFVHVRSWKVQVVVSRDITKEKEFGDLAHHWAKFRGVGGANRGEDSPWKAV